MWVEIGMGLKDLDASGRTMRPYLLDLMLVGAFGMTQPSSTCRRCC